MIDGVMNRSHWNRSRRSSMRPPLDGRGGGDCTCGRFGAIEASIGCVCAHLVTGIGRRELFPRLLLVIVRHSSSGSETVVPQRHWEDFSPGSVSEFGPRLVTRDEIVEFAAAFDPQPMHLDEAAARASMLGSLAASGWHSCCLLMRMISDGILAQSHF